MLLKIFMFVCLATEIYSDDIDKKQQVPANELVKRIIGGENAHVGQIPYIVSIQSRTHHGSEHIDEHKCEGAIIHEHWILTAAHCHNHGEVLFVKAGKHNLTKKEDHEQVIEVKKFIKPKSFNPTGPHDDIGLALLHSPLKFNQYVAKIALPAKGSEPKGRGTLSGWGATTPHKDAPVSPILQTITMPIIDLGTCNHLAKKINPKINLIISQTCTLGPFNGGLGGCVGDSGSPLVVTHNGHQEVVGIFSWSFDPCGLKGSPDVFTRVSVFITWIEAVMHKYKI